VSEIPDLDQDQAKAVRTEAKKAKNGEKSPLRAAPRAYGCYKDGSRERVLPESMGDGAGGGWTSLRGVMGGLRPSDMEPIKCAHLCHAYDLMGLQTMGETTFCFCGNSVRKAERAADTDCYMPCAGNPGMTCGAPLRVNVFGLKKSKMGECWDGSMRLEGHDTQKPWHQYRRCATCGSVPDPGEKWQQWGNKMKMANFAGCLSCKDDNAFVMLDPVGRNGFCRDYNPTVDKIVSYTYPYFAHWDGNAEFVSTKFVRRYTMPKVRVGKAAAVCKMWKQVRCELSKEAKMRNWQQHLTRSNQLSDFRSRSTDERSDKELEQKQGQKEGVKSVQRFLQCHSSKVVQCEKVCVAHTDNLGRDPKRKRARCGLGGVEVAAGDAGLKAELGKDMKGLNGIWCCFEGCQVPPEHSVYKEDGSFWCKNEIVNW